MTSLKQQQLLKKNKGLCVKLQCKFCVDEIPNIVEEFASGDLVCGNCGLVLGDRIIDTRSEWRTFANDEGDDPSRVGAAANPLLSGSQLDTAISTMDGGSGTAKDLNKIHNRSIAVKGEKNLIQAFKEISALCDNLQLNKVISDIAKQHYKRAEEEKLLRGKPSNVIIAAAIFIALRTEKVPRTFKEICALTRVSKKEIGKAYIALSKGIDTNVQSANPQQLMARYCSNLGLPMVVENASILLSKKVKNIPSLAGKSPISIAAACIFYASHLLGHGRSFKDICEMCGISEGTARGAYRTMFRAAEELKDPLLYRDGADWANLPSP
ncbi:transcription initiation factor IIB [Conidiobolus coronatus NRRL 28638]|jgi:transcription initiation factor TFIIB|uniref:Transcription initiation factor IIB n=1 Tax=Conidiobolus coronatus (strain ATCC 28846 / CBS 209.66 / NRRL 28638) TaxID=796925 RepID=A0A137P8G2_CONC2|nr:transcription initiation factor IIB [Conidiobolus coronatus NRRL 28638]|eukprot:KXN71290.1 transcription initiation factor IIB [Conidiobolus coronatus NRRL 28638]